MLSRLTHYFSTTTTLSPPHFDFQNDPPTLDGLSRRLAAKCSTLADLIKLQSDQSYSMEVGKKKKPLPKPKWMKELIPSGEKYTQIKRKLRELKLPTCWSRGETGTANATIMILGDTCTCGYRSRDEEPRDAGRYTNEPANVAEAIASWGLDYVVITSVDRDDLTDQGSGHFAETVQRLKTLKPAMLIEALSVINYFCSICISLVRKRENNELIY
ncbi:Lipoyl synthase [Handroanthus impetiginosus]|uniref:Lipoyl synthase n=1 Tax=Handroanthus impetiginosus TaxID=429701 RepID=A0A2G9HXT4_9LAMI|nr:Lipoyl synthase [Handroanthus impetiginosus]